jgi:hypothetical protein
MQIQFYDSPTRSQQSDFLLRLYFGPGGDALGACVRRAYLDLSRTLHGIVRLANANELQSKASLQISHALEELPKTLRSNLNQEAFDSWHRQECEELCALYKGKGFDSFAIGQAQKWINMAFKYVFVYGEERLPGYVDLYGLGHVPLDNIMLKQLKRFQAPEISSAWSRLRDYGEYLAFQHWIRTTFSDSVPLAVEFHLWLEADLKQGV